MATTYTTLLGLATPTQGELSGTWGTTVNDYITTYLDSAIAGTQTISGTQTAVTLSVANGTTLSQAGAGATGSSQYMVINCTGTPASLLTITAPGASKVYVVLNATAQSVKLVGTGPTAGVTLVTGEKAVCAWDGTDFVKVASSVADGVTTITFGSTGLTPNTATSGAVTVAGTLIVGNGGTGLSAGTSGGVPYFSSTSAMLSSAALTSNALVLGGGAGAAPAPLASLGTTTTVLHGNAAGAPTFGAVSLTADVSGTLPNTNGGTGQSSAFTQYGVTYASTTSVLATTANGTTGQIFTATTGGAPSWATNTAASTGKAIAMAMIFGF